MFSSFSTPQLNQIAICFLSPRFSLDTLRLLHVLVVDVGRASVRTKNSLLKFHLSAGMLSAQKGGFSKRKFGFPSPPPKKKMFTVALSVQEGWKSIFYIPQKGDRIPLFFFLSLIATNLSLLSLSFPSSLGLGSFSSSLNSQFHFIFTLNKPMAIPCNVGHCYYDVTVEGRRLYF